MDSSTPLFVLDGLDELNERDDEELAALLESWRSDVDGDTDYLKLVISRPALVSAWQKLESRRLIASLLTLVVRLLPGPDRVRYLEEFRAELADLSPRQQLAYMMRLVFRSIGLRRALRQEGEPGAEPTT